jgi:hypothetical protein
MARDNSRVAQALLIIAREHSGCRFSSISIVAAFQAKFIFNVYSDFAVINYSPLKIRCFFGFTAMPRTRRRRSFGSFGQKTQANSKLPASSPIRLCPRQSSVFSHYTS